MKGQEKILFALDPTSQYKKKSHHGPYDNDGILCRECDNRIGVYDNYAFQILSSHRKFEKMYQNNELLAWKTQDFDYKRLKLFSISLIWRAHITKRPEFRAVQLGKFAAIAREMILNGNPGSPDDFATVFTCLWSENFGLDHSWLSPFREKYSGTNVYRFQLPGYPMLIKVDSRPLCEPFRHFALNESGPLFIMARKLESSKEFGVLRANAKRLSRA
jgi:hypothetical protein